MLYTKPGHDFVSKNVHALASFPVYPSLNLYGITLLHYHRHRYHYQYL